MKEKNKKILVEIFRIVLDIEDADHILTVRRLTEKKWDSLAHVSIVSAIESEFNLSLDFADAERMTSFAATCILLEERGL